MAKVIAVDWDDSLIRLACGARSGTGISLEKVDCVPMSATTDDPFQAIGAAVRKFAESCNVARCDFYAAAPRVSMELRSLQLPPAEDNDLPDMVRFASQRSFAQIGDSWPMDFVRLPPTDQEGLTVLAAAVNPNVISKLKSACEPHHLQGLFVRSLATARLAITAKPSLQGECVLCVNVVGQEADLVVTEKGQVTMIRTARLPVGDEAAVAQSLLGEIKRTRFAAESQRSTAKPTHIVIWGDCGGGKNIVSVIEEGTKIDVSQIHLNEAVQAANVDTNGHSLEQFVPVAGMLHQACYKDQFSIDFVHPRKREEKKKPILQIALAATLATAIVGGGLWWYISEHKTLDQQIAEFQKTSTDLDATVKVATGLIADWEKLERFEKSNIQWLDQLVYLSDNALGADKVMLNNLAFSSDPRSGRSRMSMNVFADTAESVMALDESLRDAGHVVQHKKLVETKEKGQLFQWFADPVIEINPDKVAAPEKRTPAESSVAPEEDSDVKDDDQASDSESAKPAEEGSDEDKESGESSDASESQDTDQASDAKKDDQPKGQDVEPNSSDTKSTAKPEAADAVSPTPPSGAEKPASPEAPK